MVAHHERVELIPDMGVLPTDLSVGTMQYVVIVPGALARKFGDVLRLCRNHAAGRDSCCSFRESVARSRFPSSRVNFHWKGSIPPCWNVDKRAGARMMGWP